MQETFGMPEMSGGPEMLFISGFMIVAGAVLVIMYNTELLLRLDPAGRGRLAAFRAGVAHGHRLSAVEPLPHRDDHRHLRHRHVQRDFHGDHVQSQRPHPDRHGTVYRRIRLAGELEQQQPGR